jgi:hypothetical protein
MAQLGQKAKAAGDVATIAVSLDKDKPDLAAYAQRLGKDWTVLCEYKGYESRSAKDYGVTGVASTFVLDGRGRLRLGDNLYWLSADYVEDLRMEAYWAKKRGAPAPAPAAAPPPAADAAPAAAEASWIFHLKSGGKIKAVSYTEADGKYVLKLQAGSTTVSKESVERISKVEPAAK